MNIRAGGDIPVGFGMALSGNPEAMEAFSGLSRERQTKIIEGTHNIRSMEEMRGYVNKIISMDFG